MYVLLSCPNGVLPMNKCSQTLAEEASMVIPRVR